MATTSNAMQKILIESLQFLEYKIENDKFTVEELYELFEVFVERLHARAEIRDLSTFYGQSESNVRNVLSRRPLPKEQKPQRKVLFSFGFFASIKPETWRKKP